MEISRDAEIAYEVLPSGEKERVSRALEALRNFPQSLPSSLKYYKIKPIPNHFVAKAGRKYRIIFELTSEKEVIVKEIVNHDRLEKFFHPLEKGATVIERF